MHDIFLVHVYLMTWTKEVRVIRIICILLLLQVVIRNVYLKVNALPPMSTVLVRICPTEVGLCSRVDVPPKTCVISSESLLPSGCFTSTETIRLIRDGGQNDFHTAPELWSRV